MLIESNEKYKIYKELSTICKKNLYNDFKNLIERENLDINYVDQETGWSILMLCSYFNFHLGIDYLINKGADVNKAEKSSNNTPLHLAIAMITDNTLTVQALLKDKKVNINIQNNQGFTPVMSACTLNDAIALKLLMPFKPNWELKDKKNKTALDYALISNNDFAQAIIEQQIFKEKIVLNDKLITKVNKI